MGMVGRQRSTRRAVHVDRHVEMPREPVDGVMRAARASLCSEQSHRALGVRQQIGHLLHDIGVADEVRRSAIRAAHAKILGITHLRCVRLAIHDVVRDFEEARPGRAVVHLAKGNPHHFRNAICGHHQRREFADGRHHFGVTQLLQAAHAVLFERRIAADQQHRAFGAERVRHARYRVGSPGARRNYGAT